MTVFASKLATSVAAERRKSMSAKPQANQIVTVVVDRSLPHGVFVHNAQDGTQGFIRRREMSWEGDIDPCTLVSKGQQIQAVVLSTPKSIIGLNLATSAPYPTLGTHFANGMRREVLFQHTFVMYSRMACLFKFCLA